MTKRRESLFIYTVKGCNPNGDPDNGNYPRVHSDGRVWATDVRLKKFARMEAARRGFETWIQDKENITASGLFERKYKEVFATNKKPNEKTPKEDIIKTISHFIDAKWFGIAVPTPKFEGVGPIQMTSAESLNIPQVMEIAGTAGFLSDSEKSQNTLRTDYAIDYAVMASYATVSEQNAAILGTTDEDVNLMYDCLWKGMQNVKTRSKLGHEPQFLLIIEYPENEDQMCWMEDLRPFIDFKVKSSPINSVADFSINLQKLHDHIAKTYHLNTGTPIDQVYDILSVTVKKKYTFPLENEQDLKGWKIENV